MRLSVSITAAIFFLTSCALLAQQSSSLSKASSAFTSGFTVENDMLATLLIVLDKKKGSIALDDIDSALLGEFNCKYEYNQSSLGTSGDDNGLLLSGFKAHCKEMVIQYWGRVHHRDSDNPFHYGLSIFLFPSVTQCVGAEMTIKLLSDRGWTIQNSLPNAKSAAMLPSDGVMPSTEMFRPKTGDESLSIHWVPKENPNYIESVPPAHGCLKGIQIVN